jgi:hypothetical protein
MSQAATICRSNFKVNFEADNLFLGREEKRESFHPSMNRRIASILGYDVGSAREFRASLILSFSRRT